MALPLAYMGITAGISAAKQGLGFWMQENKFNEADRRQKKAWQDKKRQVSIANAQEAARVERSNQRIKLMWDMDLQRYNRQLQMNREAAERAYIGEQMQASDHIAAFMFQQTDLLKELTRSAGESAARGYTSRSANLAELKDVYGEYYRSTVMSAGNLGRQLEASAGAMDQISRDEYAANLAAHANVAIQPELEVFRPLSGPQRPSNIQRNTGLRIGQALATVALDTTLAALKGPKAKPTDGGSGTNSGWSDTSIPYANAD